MSKKNYRRFINEDTYKGDIKDPLSLNYYAYCAGNPIMYADPSGHEPQEGGNWFSNFIFGAWLGVEAEQSNENRFFL